MSYVSSIKQNFVAEPCLPLYDTYAFVGTGKNADLARLAANTMSSLGRPSFGLSGTELLHGSLGAIPLAQCVIALSKSGTTTETQQALACIAKLWPEKLIYCLTCEEEYAGIGEHIHIGNVKELNSFGNPLASSAMFCTWLMAYCAQACILTDEQLKSVHPGGALGAQNG